MNKTVSSILVALFLVGCATAQPYQFNAAFDPTEHMPYTRDGSATITGQAFLKRNDGQLVTCAGTNAVLYPDTAFNQEVIYALTHGYKISEEIQVAKERMQAAGATKKVVRTAPCDAQGNFTFENLPAGNWIVIAAVKWRVRWMQGGDLAQKIQTYDNQETRVILSAEHIM